MPADPHSYFDKARLKALDWREEAKKYEMLAKSAKLDGDAFHAERAKADAAQCRQNARLLELGGGHG